MVVVAGEALIDLVISPDGAVTATLGGAPFNTARALGRLGVEVSFAGSLSRDRFGDLLARQLAADGVDLAIAQRVDAPTTLAAAELDERGTANYYFYIAGTSAPSYSSAPGPLVGDVLFTGGLGLVLEPMASAIEAIVAAADSETMVMVDVNCRPRVIDDRDRYLARLGRVLARADVVKVSVDDLGYLAPDHDPLDAGRGVLERGPTAVLLTAGGDAVHVLARTAAGVVAVTVDVAPVEVVDTIGAGDAFGAGFVAWWQASRFGRAELPGIDRLVPAVRAACQAAGITCSRRGAEPPWRHELPANW